MSEQVTIIANDSSFVGLGLMAQTGRDWYHINIIKDAMQGGTMPDEDQTRFRIEDVTILRGYQWQVLLDRHNKMGDLLNWHADRTKEVAAITVDLTKGIQDDIDDNVAIWEQQHPRPGNGRSNPDVASPTDKMPMTELDPHGIQVSVSSSVDDSILTVLPSDETTEESPQDDDSEDSEPEEDSNDPDEEEEPEEPAQDDVVCQSKKGRRKCALPADHDEMHSTTIDPTDGDAPRWSDEEQVKEDIPF